MFNWKFKKSDSNVLFNGLRTYLLNLSNNKIPPIYQTTPRTRNQIFYTHFRYNYVHVCFYNKGPKENLTIIHRETILPCFKLIYVHFVFRKKTRNMKYALKHYNSTKTRTQSNTLRKQLTFNIRFAVINK